MTVRFAWSTPGWNEQACMYYKKCLQGMNTFVSEATLTLVFLFSISSEVNSNGKEFWNKESKFFILVKILCRENKTEATKLVSPTYPFALIHNWSYIFPIKFSHPGKQQIFSNLRTMEIRSADGSHTSANHKMDLLGFKLLPKFYTTPGLV